MLRRLILVTLSLFVMTFAGIMLSPIAVFAENPQENTPQGQVCAGVGAATANGCNSGINLTTVVRNIINIFSVIVGVVAVIMILFAGFKYITAGGDSGNITSAKNTLIYAIVGLVIAGLSQVIVQFVLESVD